MRRSHRALQGPRAIALSSMIVGLSLLGHVLGGGAPPAPVPFLLTVIVITPVVWWAARRRLGPVRTIALLGAGQVVVHDVFQATAPAVANGHVHDHVHAAGPSGAAGHVGGHGWQMLAGHAVATVVLAAAITWVDDLAARLLDFLRLLALAARHVGPVARQAAVPAMPAPRAFVVLRPAVGAVGRRGPPGS